MDLLNPSWIELLRLFDALFATTLVGVLAGRTYRFWQYYDRQQKMLVISYQLYMIAIAYTSFELYSQYATIGYRSYIVFAANIFAAYALIMNKKPGLMTLTEYNQLRYLEAQEQRKKRIE